MIHNLETINFKNFTPPASEPIFAPKSIVFFVLNFLTLGTYGSAETMKKAHTYKNLRRVNEKMLKQIESALKRLNALEAECMKFSGESSTLDKTDLDNRVKNLSDQVAQAKKKKLKDKNSGKTSVVTVALLIVGFVGQMLSNLVTLGVYGVYKNYSLKNEVTLIESKNAYLQKAFGELVLRKTTNMSTLIDGIKKNTDLENNLTNISGTPDAQAYLKEKQATDDLASLKQQEIQLQKELDDLQQEKNKALQDTQKINTEIFDLVKITTDQQKANSQLQLVIKHNKDQEKIKDQQLQAAKVSAASTKSQLDPISALLDTGFKGFKAPGGTAADVLKKVEDLCGELGPLPPKHGQILLGTAVPDIEGAIDRGDDESEDGFYLERYSVKNTDTEGRFPGDRNTALGIISNSYRWIFNETLGVNILGYNLYNPFNKVGNETPGSEEIAQAVYRWMVYDLLKRAGVKDNGCTPGGKVIINENESLCLLPSNPEKALKMITNAQGEQEAVVFTHLTQRDDFTPPDEVLQQIGVPHGHDAPSIAIIMSELSEEEEDHLMIYLLMPASKKEFYYKKTEDFLKNDKNPKVIAIKRAGALINDLALMIKAKFPPQTLI